MLAEIVGQVRTMDTLVVEIAKASVEQSQGLEQITKAMSEMDRVTQANAATAEESAGVAHELSTQSVQLGVAVQQLNAFSGIASRIEDATPIRPRLSPAAAPGAPARAPAPPVARMPAPAGQTAAVKPKVEGDFWR
jgi:methyl-accepting chemotaxis protein